MARLEAPTPALGLSIRLQNGAITGSAGDVLRSVFESLGSATPKLISPLVLNDRLSYVVPKRLNVKPPSWVASSVSVPSAPTALVLRLPVVLMSVNVGATAL